jgi:hypothetical protein
MFQVHSEPSTIKITDKSSGVTITYSRAQAVDLAQSLVETLNLYGYAADQSSAMAGAWQTSLR